MTGEDPMSHSGARWCESHSRWECAADKPNHHASAIRGQAYCKHHVGKSTELAKAQGQANLLAWSTAAAAGMVPLDTAQVVMDQLRLAVMRAGLYGELLRAQVEEQDTRGLVGVSRVGAKRGRRSGEHIRGLARLEAEERDRVVKFAKTAHDMGVDDRHIEIAQEVSDRVVAAALAGLAAIPGLLPADRDAFIRAYLGSLGVQSEALELEGARS